MANRVLFQPPTPPVFAFWRCNKLWPTPPTLCRPWKRPIRLLAVWLSWAAATAVFCRPTLAFVIRQSLTPVSLTRRRFEPSSTFIRFGVFALLLSFSLNCFCLFCFVMYCSPLEKYHSTWNKLDWVFRKSWVQLVTLKFVMQQPLVSILNYFLFISCFFFWILIIIII